MLLDTEPNQISNIFSICDPSDVGCEVCSARGNEDKVAGLSVTVTEVMMEVRDKKGCDVTGLACNLCEDCWPSLLSDICRGGR